MRITNILEKIFILAIFINLGGCEPETEPDPCLAAKWAQTKEYEIKLAIHMKENNPNLPGGSAGSQKPSDFQKMVASGTMEKIECSDSTSGQIDLGNSYINKGVDFPAPIIVSDSYWIGHVVYVYEYDNDEDYLNLNLTVKITMLDGQSYRCSVPVKIFGNQLELVPGEMYYYALLEIFSDIWVKM
jgi:hypothetical protein